MNLLMHLLRPLVRRVLSGVVVLMAVALSPALTSRVEGQEVSLQGRVRDSGTAAVEGARVLLRRSVDSGPVAATATDELGFYRMDGLSPGDFILEVQRLGFALFQTQVELSAGMTTENIELVVEAIEVEGLTVSTARRREEIAFQELPGLTVRTIDATQLRTLPGFIEADPLRAAEALPGVTTTSDFSAAFNVRGGSADQNLILLDGVPLFNPAHLGGLVSVFNPDLIERAELQSGGFSAEYGGRVSSVLDIQTDPGDGGPISIDGAVSLLTGRASVSGGLSEGARNALGLRDAKWRVGGRRSYFDVLFAPFVDVPYRLGDVQAVFESWTGDGDRLSITGYSGGDAVDLTSLDDDGFPLRVDWDWGNDAVGASWTKLLAGGSSVDVHTAYSRFDTGLFFPDFADTEFASAISQSSFGVNWEYRPMRDAVLKVGTDVRQMDYLNRFESGGTEFAAGEGSGWGVGSYGQLRFRPTENWLVEAGVRFDGWYPRDWERTTEFSPRISLKRFFDDGTWALKGSVGRFTQFLHSIRDEEIPLGLDIWVLTGPEAPHVVSDQAQFGVEINPRRGLFFSAEAYVRDFEGVVTTNFADDPNDDLDSYLPGEGLSYGVDLFAQKTSGQTTGWIAVSWLKATRKFPDVTAGLEPFPEVEYAPIFDRRWDVDIVLSRSLDDRTEVGVRWNFGTGLPFTRPVGSFPFLSPRVTEGKLEWDLEGEDPEEDAGAGNRRFGVLLGPRNSARYPVRHRLDASIRRSYTRSWGTFTPYINVLNVYNQKNVLFYFFEYDRDPPTRSGVSMFPLLPTIGVDISF